MRFNLIRNIYWFFKTLFLSIFSWIGIIAICSVFILYRRIIDCILKAKLRSSYGGLMDKADGYFLKPDSTMCCTIAAVLIIKSDKEIDFFNVVKRALVEKIFDDPELYPKLTGTKHYFSGYGYLIKNNCNIDDVLSQIKPPKNQPFDEEYLQMLTGEIQSSELPKNESIMWGFYTCNVPLERQKDDNNCYRYPLIVRFHHAVGDGTSLISFLIKIFASELSRNYSEDIYRRLFKEKPDREEPKPFCVKLGYCLKQIAQGIKTCLNIIFVSMGRILQSHQLKPIDVNALHSLNQSGQKIAVWVVEEYPECIPMIKKIKKKIPGATFSSVVHTAISASITSFFQRNSFQIPDYISCTFTSLLSYPQTDPAKPAPMKNKTTPLIMDLSCTNKYESLIEALKAVSNNTRKQIRNEEALINRFMIGQFTGWVPIKFLSDIVKSRAHTLLISNVPGGSEINFLGVGTLEKIIPLTPNLRDIGITITLLSYDDRLQIGLLVDKALLNSRTEAQTIVNDILRNIRMLDEETKKNCIARDACDV